MSVSTVDDRDNQAWVSAMTEEGPQAAAAQRELRAFLVRALGRVLSSRGFPLDLCEDVAQDALLRIRERVHAFRGDSRFTTWALAVATRMAFDELRRRRWRDVPLEALSEGARAPVVLELASTTTEEQRLTRERVGRALAQIIESELTDKQRAVLAAELQGVPHAEIAARLGMNRNALYKLAHDARKRVKAHLATAGFDAAAVLWAYE